MALRKHIFKLLMSELLAVCLTGCTASSASSLSSASPSSSAAQKTAQATPSPAASSTPSPSASVLPDSSFTVTFIDVGQGDSSLIQCDGKAMLIDGGEPDQSQKIYAILKAKGIDHLDYIVATHTHSDHAGGLSGALQYASCDEALTTVTSSESSVFTTFLQQCEKHAVPVIVPAVGDTYSLGSASFKILGPTDMEPAMDENDKSLVLKMTYGSTSFLFTGDAEQEEQQLLMYNDYEDLRADVLKASHHGSSNGASAAWIKAVQPKMTVISCGTGNSYGHPHQETLSLLQQYGSALYRTDLQGDIVMTSDGTTVTAVPEKNADADVWQPGAAASTSASVGEQAQAAVSTGTYVVNKNTMKFHQPNCTSVSKISAKNRWDFTGSRQELIDQGYVPCKICNP